MGHFGKNGPIWSFSGPKLRHMSKFGESGQIIYSIKVYKIYFSQVYTQNLIKNVINGVNFFKISHFCENSQNWVRLVPK